MSPKRPNRSFKPAALNPEIEDELTDYLITRKMFLLRDHFQEIEQYMDSKSEPLKKTLILEYEKTKDDEDDSNFNYNASDELSAIEYIYLRMHRYTAILTAYSYLESTLTRICNTTQTERNIALKLNELNGDGIERCMIYLKKCVNIDFSGIESQWQNIQTLNKLRNCIIHADGDVNKMKSKEKLLNVIERIPYLFFIEDHLIMIEAKFIENALTDIETTLKYLLSRTKK